MTEIPKDKPFRSERYKKWIKSLPCCVTGLHGVDAHHITGSGKSGMGIKPGDNYLISLSRINHSLLHHNPKKWETMNGTQISHLDRITELAKKEGQLDPFLCFSTGLEEDV